MLEVAGVAMQFLRRPKPPAIRIEVPGGGMSPYVAFDADAFEVEAAVDLRGSGAGARLGWTQLQSVDVNRALYRGATADAGRIEVFRDRSSRATARVCRDVMLSSDIFTCPPGTQRGLGYTPMRPMNINLSPVRLPATVRVSHADKPGDGWMAQYENERTRRPNHLAWALIEMRFCAVLLLRQRDGRLDQLGHFGWSLKWEDRFELVSHGRDVAGLRASGVGQHAVAFTPFAHGPVGEGRFAALIAAPNGQTCNERAYLRNNHPEEHHYAVW